MYKKRHDDDDVSVLNVMQTAVIYFFNFQMQNMSEKSK